MSNEQHSEVTAVMITQNKERHPYVMMSIRSFLKQTYPASRLLIVNDGVPVDMDHPRIQEIILPFQSERTLGDLRNIALDHIETPFVIQWDDDDWSHPERIQVQMNAAALSSKANVLKRQYRYDVVAGKTMRVRWRAIPGTILHPASDLRYPSLRREEDTVFFRKWKKADAINLLDNEPGLYVRLFTGQNTWGRNHIMSGETLAEHPVEVQMMLAELNESDELKLN